MRPEEAFREYWDVVKCYALQGRLQEAFTMLQAHSAISSASDSEKKQVMLALSTHPLVSLMQTAEEAGPGAEQSMRSGMGDGWATWRQHVENLGRSKLVTSIPQLSDVVDILLGDDEITAEACRDEWDKFALAKLLYKSGPTFSLAAIAYLVDFGLSDKVAAGDVTDQAFRSATSMKMAVI